MNVADQMRSGIRSGPFLSDGAFAQAARDDPDAQESAKDRGYVAMVRIIWSGPAVPIRPARRSDTVRYGPIRCKFEQLRFGESEEAGYCLPRARTVFSRC